MAIVAAAGVRVAEEDVGAVAVDVLVVAAGGTAVMVVVAAGAGTRAFATDDYGFPRIKPRRAAQTLWPFLLCEKTQNSYSRS